MNSRPISYFFALLASSSPLLADDAPPPPNIIVIMTDDSAYADLGSYGGEIDTPHLDRLAASGVRLSSYYTNGRCSPTRASMLTGMEPATVGFGGGTLGNYSRQFKAPAHRGRLPYEIPLLPELLKEADYQTLMVGKWHLGGTDIRNSKKGQKSWKEDHIGWDLTEEEIQSEFLAMPAQRGFDRFFGTLGAEGPFFFTPKQPHIYLEGNVPAKLEYTQTYSMNCFVKDGKINPQNQNHGKTAKAYYDTDGNTLKAVEMVKAVPKDSPFFLYLAYRAPHKPHQAPDELVQKYLKRYADLESIAAKRTENALATDLLPDSLPTRTLSLTGRSQKQIETLRYRSALHAAMVEKVDENIGVLIEGLKAAGQLENTLILYTSDNGPVSDISDVMASPYTGSKALVWEGGLKTHFIASWPKHIPENSILHTPVWCGDIFTTCLEAAGVDYPETFRSSPTQAPAGKSVLAELKGKTGAARDYLFFNDKGQQGVIKEGKWKLLIEPGWYLQTSAKEGTDYQLFDLTTDPLEIKNVAEQHPDLVKELAAACDAWKVKSKLRPYAELYKIRPRDPF